MKYLTCVIIGHGGFLTKYDETNNPDLIEIITPVNFEMITFAAPTESCSYPPELLINLKDTLLTYLNDENITDNNINNVFQQAVNQSQIDVSRFRYGYKEWGGYFSETRYKFTENVISGNKYVEKIFKDCPEADITCGIYILKNNVNIPTGTRIHIDNFTFTDMCTLFKTKYNIDEMFLLDCTCSVIYNPENTEYIKDPRKKRNIMNHFLKAVKINGGKKNKLKYKKNKRKKTTKLYNKKIRKKTIKK
jgi:hypothetical protein